MQTSSKKLQKPSLVGVTSLQEAITVLNTRKAPKIFTQAISNIFKVDMTNPTSKTWVMQQLQETENTLKKEEEEEEVNKQKQMGYQQNMKETEGNPPSGAEPTPESIADKTGVTAQADGPSLDDIKDKNPPADPAQLGAHAQQGESQLKEAIEKVFNLGNGVDPLNQSVIHGMANGMSQVEATNAASIDNHMMEAVFNKMAAKVLVPIFKAQAAQVESLHETIRISDQKLEGMRKENKGGLNEAIQLNPGQTIIPIPTGIASTDHTSTGQTIEEHRLEISQKLKDNTIYN